MILTMHLKSTGIYKPHGSTKKRRMIGQSKSKVESLVIKEKMSSETFRETDAVCLMRLGI